MDYSADSVKDSELEPLAADVRYEFDMLQLCASTLDGIHGTGIETGFLRNVLVESLELHARNLLHFFSTKVRDAREDDVVAKHYSPDWDPKRDGGEELEYLRSSLLPALHKRLAHITAYRVRVPKENDAESVEQIRRALVRLIDRFLASLPEDRRRWFETNSSSRSI